MGRLGAFLGMVFAGFLNSRLYCDADMHLLTAIFTGYVAFPAAVVGYMMAEGRHRIPPSN